MPAVASSTPIHAVKRNTVVREKANGRLAPLVKNFQTTVYASRICWRIVTRDSTVVHDGEKATNDGDAAWFLL
jgi:hypothetical protein